jgi:low affinity Fe/Cu permease
MADEKQFAVIQLPELKWPTSNPLPAGRFRLFVAADISDVSVHAISEFASAALSQGMVYFSAWGRDCERLHDIIDEVIVEDEIGEHRFVGPTANDVVMTTWHEDETLEEALDFFTTSAIPTNGFAVNSSFRLVICIGNPDWAETATRVLKSTASFG